MKVTIVKKRMRDRVAMPHVETWWEKAALQANALNWCRILRELVLELGNWGTWELGN